MNTQNRKYFLIIVHHGQEAPTRQLVAAVLGGTKQPDRLIIVDNADIPLVIDKVTNPAVTVVRPQKNSGYAGGINIGLGTLFVQQPQPHDVVICCNNDLQITSQTMAQLAAWIEDNAAPALWGYQAGTVNLLSGRAKLMRQSTSPLSTGQYIHGAFFAFPWQVVMKIKGVPDTYFLYWEDVLLSAKVQRAGFPLVVIPDLAIQHLEKTQPATGQQLYYLVRNGAHYLQTYTPPGIRAWWGFYNYVRYGYHRLRSNTNIARAIRDGQRGLLQ